MAISASAMPGRDRRSRLDEPGAPMFWNELMIPHTVPNSPMNGVMLAVVARNGTRRLELRHLHRRRAQQRPIDRVQALQCWTSGGRRRLWPARAATAAQLRVQLRVARLKQSDERALPRDRADRLHLGELAALAEHLQKRGRLALSAPERPELVKDDAPGNSREEQQDQQNDFGQRAGVRDEADDVGIRGQLAGPSLRLRRLRESARA